MKNSNKTLRLILGDQLNEKHSWFQNVDDSIVYVLIEVATETDYVTHHIQKVIGFFAAMREFSKQLQSKGHNVIYIRLTDANNLQTFEANLSKLLTEGNFSCFEYQEPDEYRVDLYLKSFCSSLSISHSVVSSEHFLSERNLLSQFFEGKKTYLMESFYRQMRKNHSILMDGANPVGGKWNFDADNRKKIPANHVVSLPLLFSNNTSEIEIELQKANVKTIGNNIQFKTVFVANKSFAIFRTFGIFRRALFTVFRNLSRCNATKSMVDLSFAFIVFFEHKNDFTKRSY